MNIYIASNNKGKINEIKSFFPNSNIISQDEISTMLNKEIDTEETGKTFEENAILKVKGLFLYLKDIIKKNDIILADDSGIIVPSLPNLLGVYTKRQMEKWCNENNKTQIDFYNYISLIANPKTCFFESVIACYKNGKIDTFKGRIEGNLAAFCRGDNGFGFDPIFEISGKTLAELSSEEKAKINPRIIALKLAQERIKKDITQ